MKPAAHLVFGSLTVALAASILVVDLPYYAIAATAVLCVLLIAWLTLTARDIRSRGLGN